MFALILQNLIPIVFTIMTPIMLVIARHFLQALAKKYHMEWILNYEEKVDKLVETGIAAAEKTSLNAVKSGNPPAAGQEKLQSVINFVNEELDQHDLPKKSGEALATMVEAKLNPMPVNNLEEERIP